MTLSANSTLEMGSGASILHFADSQSAAWTSGQLLTITNWSGLTTGGGTDQIFVGNSASALTSGQLQQITFDFGGGDMRAATLLANGELVAPIPEPTTVFAAMAAMLALAWRERRRFLRKRTR